MASSPLTSRPALAWAVGAFVVFGVVALLPIAYLGYLSVHDADGRFTMSFYERYLDPTMWTLLWKSIRLAGGATLAALAVGVPIGVLLGRANLWLKPLWLALTIVPLLLPPYMITICWFYLLTPEGWINQSLLGSLGIPPIDFQSLDGLPGAMFSLALSYYPIIALLTWVGVAAPDRAHEEAGRLVTSPWRAFRRLTLPLALPFIATGAVFIFFFSLINYAVPYQFSIGGIFVSEIHSQYQAHHNHGQAAALTVPFIVASLFLLIAERRLVHRRTAIRGRSTTPPPRLRLGWWQLAAQVGVAFVTALSSVGPIAVLVWLAWPFADTRNAIEACRPELTNAVTLSALAATVTLALATGVATLARSRGWWAKLVETCGMLPIAIPPMSLGISLILIWNRSSAFGSEAAWIGSVSDAVYGTFLVMIFALIAKTFPFAMRPLHYGLGQVDPALTEASRLRGVGPTKTFFRITLPLAWRSVALAWFLAFLFSIGEYDAVHLVQQPGYAMLAPRLIGSFHNFRQDLVSNNALLLMAIIVFPIVLYMLIPKGRRAA